jgi:Ca-activated chloride channel family protein
LENIFNTLDLVYAKKMSIRFENSPMSEIRTFFQIEPSVVQYATDTKEIFIGDLFYGKKSIYLLEFLIHPLLRNDKEISLIKANLQMEVSRDESEWARIFPKLVLPVEDNKFVGQPPDEIVRAISRLNMYFMQERSREDVKIGNYMKATQRLNYLGTKLISEGELQLAHKVFVESEAIQKNHSFSQNGEKEIKYGTKMLLASNNPR